jgi:hypothetical protein
VAHSPPRCLLYEVAPRGGLDAHLRDDAAAPVLTWEVRLHVAAGIVATALHFLHSSDPAAKAFHRDVKSANVALMADWTPKLIDCDLAKRSCAARWRRQKREPDASKRCGWTSSTAS